MSPSLTKPQTNTKEYQGTPETNTKEPETNTIESTNELLRYKEEIAQFRFNDPGTIICTDEELVEILKKKKEAKETKNNPQSESKKNNEDSKVKRTQSTKETQTITNSRFIQIKEFNLTIPRSYNHKTQLAEFKKKHKKDFYFYNEEITDKNFKGATNQLIPGRTYKVSIFQIQETVSSKDCLTFLKSQNAILVGAQGLSVAYEQKKEEFPESKWMISFDEEEALYKDAGGARRVPRALRSSDGGWRFRLGCFQSCWSDDNCLLCFRDL